MTDKLRETDDGDPTFPLTFRAKKEAAQKEDSVDSRNIKVDADNIELDKREETKEKLAGRRQERSATKLATDDPGDTYETWRNDIFKHGIHKLRIWYRDATSRTWVNPPQPLLDEMIPFEDLCNAHRNGAVIRIQIYKPNAAGKLQPQTPPLEIPIAPEGGGREFAMQGFGNPFAIGGMNPNLPATASIEKILEWSERQAEKRDALQEKSLTMQQQNSNNWLQTLMALQQNNPKNAQADQNFMLMMVQMMQQSAQTQTAMITGMFQAMNQQSQQNTQLLVAALGNNKGDENMMKLYELQQNQNNILLQNALQGGDLKGQVALLRELQEFTEPTALGEVARIAEAISLGDNLKNLTEAAGERIRDGSKTSTPGTPPEIPPPANRQLPAHGSTTNQQNAQQTKAIQQAAIQQAQEAIKDPKSSGLNELLQAIKASYLAGAKAEDLADTIWTSKKNLAIAVNSFEPAIIIEKLGQYHKILGVTELTTSAGRDFVLDFLQVLKRKEVYHNAQPTTGDATP